MTFLDPRFNKNDFKNLVALVKCKDTVSRHMTSEMVDIEINPIAEPTNNETRICFGRILMLLLAFLILSLSAGKESIWTIAFH